MNKIDHIGIAVLDLPGAIKLYTDSFGSTIEHSEQLSDSKISLVFLNCSNTLIELMAPTEKGSTLDNFLAKRGPGLHHICYRVTDINLELQKLKSQGHSLIDETPRPGAHNSLIAFIHPKSMNGVLIELCQR